MSMSRLFFRALIWHRWNANDRYSSAVKQRTSFSDMTTLPPVKKWCIAMSVSVCQSACVYQELCECTSSNILYMLLLAMARSSSGSTAMMVMSCMPIIHQPDKARRASTQKWLTRDKTGSRAEYDSVLQCSAQLTASYNYLSFQSSAFSALTLLVGHQKEDPACKNWVTRCWCRYLSGVRWRLFAYGQADATASQNLIISCLFYIQTGFTFLVLAYPGCPGKEDVKWV